jgi:hypothetical protein
MGERLALYKKNVSILDSKNKTIYQLSLDSKAGEAVAGDKDANDAKFIAIGTKIYFYTDKDGVKEIDSVTKKTKTIIKKDEAWGGVGDLAAFGSNLYLLDKTNGLIIKFVGTDDGFSSGQAYLAKDVKPDFSKSISLTIDGAVWVLNSDGTVVKFIQGRPDNFSPSGIEPSLSKPTRIFTSEDTKNVYFLESSKNRIVVLGKDGVYQAQYLWSGAPASDLIVLEDSKKILLLSGSKIYSLNLK